MKVTKKRRITTGDASIDRLYAAVANYIKKRGGTTLVIGGVEVQQWPEDFEFNYRVAVRCTGRKPELKPEATTRKRRRT